MRDIVRIQFINPHDPTVLISVKPTVEPMAFAYQRMYSQLETRCILEIYVKVVIRHLLLTFHTKILGPL